MSYGQATPYLPSPRPAEGLLPRSTTGTTSAHIREKVDKCLTLDVALQATRSALLALLDVRVRIPSGRPWSRPSAACGPSTGVKRLLLRQSQVQPLLVSSKICTGSMPETQACSTAWSRVCRLRGLLLLVNYRPEYQHGWGSKTYYTQLRLDPLPPASADALLQALLGDDPGLAPLKPLLIERTEGNPFFLEESVRTLVETQALVGEPGAYRLAQALPSIQVPATVQAVLAARIDRLPPEEKWLLQTAAVIGTRCALGAPPGRGRDARGAAPRGARPSAGRRVPL